MSFVFPPIHATGLYGIQHSEPNPAAPSGDLRLLAVCQPPSDGLPPLPGVATELEHIQAVIQDSPSARTTLVTSSIGKVLSLMKAAD